MSYLRQSLICQMFTSLDALKDFSEKLEVLSLLRHQFVSIEDCCNVVELVNFPYSKFFPAAVVINHFSSLKEALKLVENCFVT
jgi:hypothetical protein